MKEYKLIFKPISTISKLPSAQTIFGAVCNIILNTQGEEAFNNYTKYRILKSGRINIIGENYYNNLSVKREFNLLLKDSDKNNVLLKYELVKKNNFSDEEVVGKVKLLVNNEKVDEQDVYVLKTQKKSFFQRIKDWLCGK